MATVKPKRGWWLVLDPNGRPTCTCEHGDDARKLAAGYSLQNGGAPFEVVKVEECTNSLGGKAV